MSAKDDGITPEQPANAGCGAVPCSRLEVIERPLLVSGQLRLRKGVPTILIDSEQEHGEKLLSLWHEVVHLLRAAGGYSQDEEDEEDVEAWAKRLAAACPDALAWVGIHDANAELGDRYGSGAPPQEQPS